MQKNWWVKKSSFGLFLLAVSVFLLVNLSQTFLVSAEANNTTTETISHLWVSGVQINGVLFTPNNLTYIVGGEEVFGVYNLTANITEDLRGTDGENWVGGIDPAGDYVAFLSATYDSNNNIYLGLNYGNLAFYNRSENITYNLNATDEGNWIGNDYLFGVSYDSNNDLVYFGGNSGLFGFYNVTSNISLALTETDTGDWMGSSFTLEEIIYVNDTYTFFGGGAAILGYYNKTANITFDLRATDIGNWISGIYIQIQDISFDSTNNLLYLVTENGGFGVYNLTSNQTSNLSGTDIGNWMSTNTIRSVVSANNDLVYLGGNSGVFGVYNRTANATYDLRTTDIGDWIGTSHIIGLTYDSNNNLIYLVGVDGVYGYYNITSNTTIDLNVPNDWVRYNDIEGITFDSDTNLIYFCGQNGVFGVYNKTLNSKEDLRTTDGVENWIGTTQLNSLAYDSNSNLVYFVGNSGVFGVYNRTTNMTSNLNGTDIDNWIGTKNLRHLVYDSTNDLIYLVGFSDVFGVYNRTENLTYNLNLTDPGNWMNSSNVEAITFDSVNNGVYVGGTSGGIHPTFGFYNKSDNITYDLRATDIGNWIGAGSFQIEDLAYDSNNNLVYILGSSLFGFYNQSNNISYNLNSTVPDDWGIFTTYAFLSTEYDPDTDLVYLGGQAGFFAAYNKTSNVTENLRSTDTDDWIGNSRAINDFIYDSNNDLLYLIGDGGIFGIYNRSSNTSSSIDELVASTASEDTGGSGAVVGGASQTISIGSVSGGGSATARITDPKIDIRNVTIFPKENIENASITVSTSSASTTLLIASTLGTVYQSFDINPFAIENENLNNVTLDFRVNKSWLSENNYTYNDVVLYRLPSENETWQELPTASITEDETYYYFTATSPGFSTFTIFVRKLPCDIGALRCFNNEVQLCVGNSTWVVTESCKGSCVLGKCTDRGLFGEAHVSINAVFFYAAIILVISAIIVVVFVKLKRNLGKNKKRK